MSARSTPEDIFRSPIARRLRGVAFFLAAGWLCLSPGVPVLASERAFWVWNRSDALTPAEIVTLRAADIRRLYWQAGEIEMPQPGKLTLRRTAPLSLDTLNPAPGNGLAIIPVVRISTAIRSPESFTGEALAQALLPVVQASPGRTVQVDFDCPDRLLGIYAERLKAARQAAQIGRLLITALDGWADAPARDALWTAVDEVYPMLYDVEKDPTPGPDPASLAAWMPTPVLDPARVRSRLASWRKCPLPWHAGLPSFARVTLYDGAGRSLGHLHRWTWQDLVFNLGLRLDRPPQLGTSLLHADRPTRLGGSIVPAGGFVAARWPDLGALRAAAAAADEAGARSVVLFRMPDPAAGPDGLSGLEAGAGGWSLAQLGALRDAGAQPQLTLTHAGDGSARLILRNDSEADLPPRFGGRAPGTAPAAEGADSRGYALEVDAPGPLFWREALPGDFRRVTGHRFPEAGSEAHPVLVAIPLARRLTFWLSHLPAHGALATGLLQMAPEADHAALRYRIANDPGPAGTWQSIP